MRFFCFQKVAEPFSIFFWTHFSCRAYFRDCKKCSISVYCSMGLLYGSLPQAAQMVFSCAVKHLVHFQTSFTSCLHLLCEDLLQNLPWKKRAAVVTWVQWACNFGSPCEVSRYTRFRLSKLYVNTSLSVVLHIWWIESEEVPQRNPHLYIVFYPFKSCWWLLDHACYGTDAHVLQMNVYILLWCGTTV